jgi:putative heme utilization carrier protein HutX
MRNLFLSLCLVIAVTGTASAQSLAEIIKKNPGRSPEWIAETAKQPLAEVTKQLVAGYRVPISPAKFDEVWLKLTEWENPLLITIVGGSVIEVHSKIPKGSYDQGFFNLEHTAQLTGHFKVENIKAIYMVEEPSRGGDVQRQVAFYDADGKRIFGVFVDRNESGGKHYPGTLKQYQAMMEHYKAEALK